MANMLELLNQYGSVDNIPESELEIHGFTRVIKDGVARLLLKKDFQNEGKDQITAEPFGEINFQVNIGKLKLVRNKLILQKIKKFLFTDLGVKKLNTIQNDFLSQFGYIKSSYLDISGEDSDSDYLFEVENDIHAFLDTFSQEGNFSELTYEPELFFNDIQADLERIFTDFQRLKAKVLDADILFERLSNNLARNIDISDFQDYFEVYMRDDEKGFLERLSHEKLVGFDYLIYALHGFLRQKGFDKVAEKIVGVKTRMQLKETLKNSVNVLPGFAQYNELSSQMKAEKDIEKKKILSQEFSKVKALLNEQKDVVLSLIELLSYENMILENIKKYIDVIGELFKVSQKEDFYESIFLDGKFDEKRDANPGVVSGDCTNGEPLPFGKLKGLSNVKVLSELKIHIGNIYLYEAQQNGKKIWHLDAIQIPAHYDWDVTVQKLFETLGMQAKAKGISKIVVSKTPEHISNYDYIQYAVLKYHKQKKGKLCGGGFIKSHLYSGNKQLQSLEDDAFLVMWEE